MIEELLNEPYWVIDFLPEQVPQGSAGQYFAVQHYYLNSTLLDDLHRRFTDILLKLNCYDDFEVRFPDEDQGTLNPAPETLSAWICREGKDLCVLLPEDKALITLNHDDLYMTVYHPSPRLLKLLKALVSSGGLFLRKP